VNSDNIQTLLDLHEQILDQEDGYWIKIEAWQVEVTAHIPHGIRYALTLHKPNGERILGYDNAHNIKVKGKKYSGQRMAFDHKHRHATDLGVHYEFKNTHQLLSDFFTEVDLVLKVVREK
jgi:Family of unknown function (DUF6516)